jgi:hypothetical protein
MCPLEAGKEGRRQQSSRSAVERNIVQNATSFKFTASKFCWPPKYAEILVDGLVDALSQVADSSAIQRFRRIHTRADRVVAKPGR